MAIGVSMIFTPEHEAIRTTVAQFIDREINPTDRKRD